MVLNNEVFNFKFLSKKICLGSVLIYQFRQSFVIGLGNGSANFYINFNDQRDKVSDFWGFFYKSLQENKINNKNMFPILRRSKSISYLNYLVKLYKLICIVILMSFRFGNGRHQKVGMPKNY